MRQLPHPPLERISGPLSRHIPLFGVKTLDHQYLVTIKLFFKKKRRSHCIGLETDLLRPSAMCDLQKNKQLVITQTSTLDGLTDTLRLGHLQGGKQIKALM